MVESITYAFAEALAATQAASRKEIDESELFQIGYQVISCAERIVAQTLPQLDPALRLAIAEEIAQYHRAPEPVIDAVHRWIPDDWKEDIKRDPKGQMQPSPANAYTLLKYHPHARGSIRFNVFTKSVEVVGGVLANNTDIDDIITDAQDWIELIEDVRIPFQDLGRRIVKLARENTFDPIRNYLLNLRWDGIPRIENWLFTYAGVRDSDTKYVREIGKRWMLAAVARGLDPGAKVDVVLVAEGDQGKRKSSLFNALGGAWYADAAIALGDKDSKMMASGAWILELPDMASFKRSEQNALKAFLTTRVDKFRMPYGRGIVAVPRRCVFVTTTNDHKEGYLSDVTGNRRYWPVECGKIDIAGVIRDRDQLWAEAVALYLAADICEACTRSTDTVWGQRPRCGEHRWWLDDDMQKVADEKTREREEIDVWAPAVLAWAANPIKQEVNGLKTTSIRVDVTTDNVLKYGIGKSLDHCNNSDAARVGKILRQAGYESVKPHRGPRVYFRPGRDDKPKLSIV